ncbi:MAG: hypothetical protein ACYSUK_11510, partial [Planctomycetota bacterium]
EKISRQMWNRAKPISTEYANRANRFMRGKLNPTASPMYASGRMGIEDQYDVARDQMISNLPVGGGLYSNLGDLEVDRANALTGLEGRIAQDDYNKAYGFATGVPQSSASSLTTLAGTQAEAAAQETAAKYGALGDIGAGAGTMYGMKKGGGGTA